MEASSGPSSKRTSGRCALSRNLICREQRTGPTKSRRSESAHEGQRSRIVGDYQKVPESGEVDIVKFVRCLQRRRHGRLLIVSSVSQKCQRAEFCFSKSSSHDETISARIPWSWLAGEMPKFCQKILDPDLGQTTIVRGHARYFLLMRGRRRSAFVCQHDEYNVRRNQESRIDGKNGKGRSRDSVMWCPASKGQNGENEYKGIFRRSVCIRPIFNSDIFVASYASASVIWANDKNHHLLLRHTVRSRLHARVLRRRERRLRLGL